MKTNVRLKSKDRNLLGVIIRQDTNNEFLSVTDLQEAYSAARRGKGWSDRRINDILSSNISAERVYFILKEGGFIETDFPVFMKHVEDQSLIKVMKHCGAYKTVGRGDKRTTMCNPYIWVMLALELNPEIYATVVVWLTDSLILKRIEAGDKYNDLCRSASVFKDVDYVKIAKGLNYIVFNIHESQIRNKATQEELKEINDIQKSLAFAIDMGYIKSFDNLISEMRKIWSIKWGDKNK